MNEVVDTIKIEKLEGGAFNVIQGDKYSDTLSYDEMLGLISALTIAKEPNCLRWMQTKEGHEQSRVKIENMPSEVEFEDILVPENIGIWRLKGEYMRDFSNGDGLYITFNDTQVLGFCDGKYRCDVISKDFFLSDWYEKIQCKLIPYNREDMEAGDTVFADLLNNIGNILSYCKVINKREVAHTTLKGGVKVSFWNEPSLQWYKIVPQ